MGDDERRLLMLKGERGEGKLGCLVVLLLLGVFVFISAKTVPVYLDKLEFEDELARVASKAGVDASETKAVEKKVLAVAASKDFDATPDDVTVVRVAKFGPSEIRIRVLYRRKVNFVGDLNYVFHFESKVSSFVGRL